MAKHPKMPVWLRWFDYTRDNLVVGTAKFMGMILTFCVVMTTVFWLLR